jgi:multicomponent Na+:H+ antiporter subunit E
MRFSVTAVVAYLLYLLLTIGSGTLLLWNAAELIIGAIFALVVAALVKDRYLKKSLRMLNPVRWFIWLIYLFPFFFAMAQANIDVAYRVITGRINPAIVRISPNLKNDMALTILANSITLTPGTLSVDVDEETNDLYVHWINVKPDVLKEMPRDYHSICNNFPDWARRIAG